MLGTKHLSALFQVFQLADWITEGLKLYYGKEAAGDLLWAVYLTFFLATFVLWLRLVHFVHLSGIVKWRRTFSCLCGCGLPSLTRASERHPSSQLSTRVYEDKPVTTLLLGLPVTGAMVTVFACESIVENRVFEHMQNMLSAYQVLLQDVPDFVLDLAIIVRSSNQEDADDVVFLGEKVPAILWFNVSFAFSVVSLLFACGACVRGFMQEEGSIVKKRPNAVYQPPTTKKCCCSAFFNKKKGQPTVIQASNARSSHAQPGGSTYIPSALSPTVVLQPQAQARGLPLPAAPCSPAGSSPAHTVLAPAAANNPVVQAAHPRPPVTAGYQPQVAYAPWFSRPAAPAAGAAPIAAAGQSV